ncbi:carboxylesterase family protein [Rhizobium sp. Root483D2]|uniref:carboxylesterase/lipase family protein n=1 Tax=Rhizobium sp. Root483D2 TaxID=1736545 RepID=UPI0007152BB9|nr:carboxylesterase family protein [Rhizobium sp. Root483D2]KQY20816.1 hypothetical protein ASD32_05260 [Rhizobium sp. Root483D2]
MRKFFGLAVLAGIVSPLGSAVAQGLTEVVQTRLGAVQGEVVDGVENFYGIPYAAPPVGDLRWAAPAPAKSWQGVRPAVEFGSNCAQRDGLESVRVENEDCLYLNVQRPAGTAADANLPVLVYIHGGGWRGGSGNVENLEKLVRDNRIIGIAINYRLGSLGFMAHPALSASAGQSGNYGFMDQQAALRWVQDNAASFGGNPKAVTIAGESAGAGSVCVQLAVPGSKGLFAGAIMQSTLCESIPIATAEDAGVALATELNCTGTDDAILACLRRTPVAQVLDAKTVMSGRGDAQSRPAVAGIPPFLPSHGTPFLPSVPFRALQSGDHAQVPVLIGSQRDEARGFVADWRTASVPQYDQAAYVKFVRERFGTDADAVLNVYPWPTDVSRYTGTYLVADLSLAGTGGGLGSCPINNVTNALAERVPTFAYEFTYDRGPGWFAVDGYAWGAAHAADLPYLMPKRASSGINSNAFGDQEWQLSSEMVRYWGAFIRNGDPAVEGQAPWTSYTSGNGPLLSIRGAGDAVLIPEAAFRSAHNCSFWEYLAKN